MPWVDILELKTFWWTLLCGRQKFKVWHQKYVFICNLHANFGGKIAKCKKTLWKISHIQCHQHKTLREKINHLWKLCCVLGDLWIFGTLITHRHLHCKPLFALVARLKNYYSKHVWAFHIFWNKKKVFCLIPLKV